MADERRAGLLQADGIARLAEMAPYERYS